jgi:hypothetical protein
LSQCGVGLLQRSALGLGGGQRVGVVGAVGSNSVQFGGDFRSAGVDDGNLLGQLNIGTLKLSTSGLAGSELGLEVVELGTESVMLSGQVINRGREMGVVVVQSGIGLFELGTSGLEGGMSLSKVAVIRSGFIERDIQNIDLVGVSSDLIREGCVSRLTLLELGIQIIVLNSQIVDFHSGSIELGSDVSNCGI